MESMRLSREEKDIEIQELMKVNDSQLEINQQLKT